VGDKKDKQTTKVSQGVEVGVLAVRSKTNNQANSENDLHIPEQVGKITVLNCPAYGI